MILFILLFILLCLFSVVPFVLKLILGLVMFCVIMAIVGKLYEMKTGIASNCMFSDKNTLMVHDIKDPVKFKKWKEEHQK